MKNKNFFLIVALAAVVVGTGCAARMVGGPSGTSGAMVYVDGQLKCVEAVGQDRVHTATLAALKDLQFGLVGDETDGAKRKVLARTNTDKKVQVVLEKESDTITEVRVSVGLFGDEVLSHQVMNQIKSHL